MAFFSFIFDCVVGILTQVFMFAQQALLATESSPQAPDFYCLFIFYKSPYHCIGFVPLLPMNILLAHRVNLPQYHALLMKRSSGHTNQRTVGFKFHPFSDERKQSHTQRDRGVNKAEQDHVQQIHSLALEDSKLSAWRSLYIYYNDIVNTIIRSRTLRKYPIVLRIHAPLPHFHSI